MGKRQRCGLPASTVAAAGNKPMKPAHAPTTRFKMSAAAYLLCLTSDGGIPLFSRKTGDLKALPYAVIGTLNGINLYGRLQGANLTNTVTDDAKILWRVYYDSVVLIIVTNNDGPSDSHLSSLLENVFSAMVLLVGIDRLKQINNVDRLKRDLKACYNLIDYLMQQLDQGLSTIGDLTGFVDCMLCPEALQLEHYLEGFTEVADSDYGCLLVRGKVAVATKKWWSLTGQELVLLSAFINSSPKTTTRDVPLFLPTSCPQASNRLLTFHLVQGVDLCFLCGPNPRLDDLEEEVPRFWKESFEMLKQVSSLHPRNFPTSIKLDKNVLGFALLHETKRKCLSSVYPFASTTEDHLHIDSKNVITPINKLKETKGCTSLRRRQELLRAMYKLVVGTYYPPRESIIPENIEGAVANPCKEVNCLENGAEIYVCMDHFKFYSIREKPYQIFILYNSAVPLYAMRSVSHQTLKQLTTYKVHQL